MSPRYRSATLCRPHLQELVEAELLHRELTHLDLADLAGDGHRERVGELPELWDLVGRDATRAELAELVGRGRGAVTQTDPRHDLLAVALGWDADHRDIGDRRVRVQELLDLARIDVLAAAD